MEIVSIFHLLNSKYRSNDLSSLTIVLFRFNVNLVSFKICKF